MFRFFFFSNFIAKVYFEEDHGIEYVYKEPKLTSLSEISERLQKQYKDKFGGDIVKIIMDSSPVSDFILSLSYCFFFSFSF